MRDHGTAIRLVAEATQLRVELEEALPSLAAEIQLKARTLIAHLEATITTVSAALAILASSEPRPPAPGC